MMPWNALSKMSKSNRSEALTTNNTYSLSVKASTGQIATVRNFVAQHALSFGFSEHEVENIRLAVDEAFTNIIKHAYNYDSSRPVYIKLQFIGNMFSISLYDHGEPFDTSNYSIPNVQEQIKAKKRGGVGVYLIKQLMDSVNYNRNQGVNEIRMIKKKEH